MNEVKNTVFSVACGNNNCELNGHVIGTANTQNTVCRSTGNPTNLRYCPACGKNTLFECPECHEWHPTRHLLNKPYVCQTQINKAVKKLNATLIPVGRWYFPPVVVLGILYPGALWYYFPDVLWAGRLVLHAMMFLPLFWLIGWGWTFSVNKKRKVTFAKKFPNEWKLIQRFPNDLN
jgi:hypothetical protein